MKKPAVVIVPRANGAFVADLRAQQLSGETVRKYENLHTRRLGTRCDEKGLRDLPQLARGPEGVREGGVALRGQGVSRFEVGEKRRRAQICLMGGPASTPPTMCVAVRRPEIDLIHGTPSSA